jgi:hypothetical protein
MLVRMMNRISLVVENIKFSQTMFPIRINVYLFTWASKDLLVYSSKEMLLTCRS